MNANAEISVKDQLKGKRIMITGTTGFLGKVVLEKLIREVPEVEKIILLIRGNKSYRTARERFVNEIVASSIFNRLREENPVHFNQFCQDKIDCATGEVTENNFGMGKEQYTKLASSIDVVINSAACVDFRAKLDLTLAINALCLLNIADLIKAAGNIPLIHVSTCYVYGYTEGDCHEENVTPTRRGIKQNPAGFFEVVPLITKLQKKIEATKKACSQPDKLDERLSELGIKESHRYGWNDTYTFTKWIGEQLIMEKLHDSTLTIVRPSIIESTYQEPVAGWIEGVKVADAIILAYAREKTRFFPARPKGVIDIIPADLVANSLILATAEAFALPERHRIYQCCSGSSNPITIGQMIGLLQTEANRNYADYDRLLPKGKPKRDFQTVNRGLFVAAMSVLRMAVLAYGGICNFVGIRNRLQRITDFVNTTMKLAVTFSFYAAPKCLFHNTKLMDLVSRVKEKDRGLFPVNPEIIKWERYMGPIHLSGLNRYSLKDRKKMSKAPARKFKKVANIAQNKGKAVPDAA
jgi:fatty acyl-CoA reductase